MTGIVCLFEFHAEITETAATIIQPHTLRGVMSNGRTALSGHILVSG